jgi:hypothetical protein
VDSCWTIIKAGEENISLSWKADVGVPTDQTTMTVGVKYNKSVAPLREEINKLEANEKNAFNRLLFSLSMKLIYTTRLVHAVHNGYGTRITFGMDEFIRLILIYIGEATKENLPLRLRLVSLVLSSGERDDIIPAEITPTNYGVPDEKTRDGTGSYEICKAFYTDHYNKHLAPVREASKFVVFMWQFTNYKA